MTTHEQTPLDRKDVVAREKERFGGVKIVCAFFGWITATGMAVLLTALLAAVGAGVGLVSSASEVAGAASDRGVSTEELGWAGAVLVLVVTMSVGRLLSCRTARDAA